MVAQRVSAGVVSQGQGRVFSTGRSIAQVKIEPTGEEGFAAFEGVQVPGVPGPPAHVHEGYDEAWYIIDGTMEFRLDEQTLVCGAGSVVFAPRGTAHTFSNPGPEPARMLAITTAAALPLIEALGALSSAGPPDPVALESLLARHKTHIVGDPRKPIARPAYG
jgi:mannose-6-phosphate isomerase-like protein (cupin superfamily)